MIKSFKEKDDDHAREKKEKKLQKLDKSVKKKPRKKSKHKDKSIIELIQMFIMKGRLDLFKKIFCCCRGKPSKIQTEVAEIEDYQRLLVK